MTKKIIFILALLSLTSCNIYNRYFHKPQKTRVSPITTKNTRSILVLWLDSSDSKTIFSDSRCQSKKLSGTSNVACWKDKSGNSNDAIQSLSTSVPTYSRNAINGKPAIKFNGKAFLDEVTPSKLGIYNSDYEIIIVAKSSYTYSHEFLIAGGNEKYEMRLNYPGFRFIPNNNQRVDVGSIIQYTDHGNVHIFSARVMDNEASYSMVDGVDTSEPGIGGKNIDDKNLTIGRRSDGTYPFSGEISEIRIYKHTLSNIEREKIEKELSKKWGVHLAH